jgi:ParB-like chromosome segregation protein Spo0J
MGMVAVLPLNQESIDNENFLNSGYDVHPLAAMFPLMEGEELERLVASIRHHELLHPITVHGRFIIDGRNRLRACQLADKPPRFEEYQGEGNAEDIFVFILDQNIQRRHIDADQRAAIVGKMKSWTLKQDAVQAKHEGQRLGGKLKGHVSFTQKPVQSSRAPQTRDKLAQLADISTYKAEQVITLLRESPELLDEVAEGKIKLKDASAKSKSSKVTTWEFQIEVDKAARLILKRAESCPVQHRAAFINAVISSSRKLIKENA